ncbi:MAG TPA: Rrf2 family transcriptional regulator [Anaerolineaceae bacterium]|nr:Rrf2 family transcriptional regulator [Anaerolineaceae bacterium]
MFKISRRLDYGLQLMIALAADNDGRPQPSAKLAEKLQIPLPFLHQIAHTLMQSGLIKASPGPRGGLRLNQPAKSVSVLKITETLEGPVVLTPCLDCTDNCVRKDGCVTQFMWSDLQGKVIKHLESVNLEMLAAQQASTAVFDLAQTETKRVPQPIAAD